MRPTHLVFDKKPNNASAMAKALLLPRAGFNADKGLPALKASWRGALADPQALADYYRTLGLAASDYLPIAYPHVMAGTLCMNMLAHSSFPIRLLGALHLKNSIVQHRPILATEVVDIHMTLGGFRLTEKGMEFDFFTELFAADNEASNPLLWRETSTYFVRGKFNTKENNGGGDHNNDKSFELDSLEDAQTLQQWLIPNDRGRVYARISGDYNPIHMSKIAAKAFGFKRDIAHGFGVMAQAIERANILPPASTLIETGQTVQLDAIFKGPIFLDSNVSLKHNAQQSAERFDVYCDDNPRPNLCFSITQQASV